MDADGVMGLAQGYQRLWGEDISFTQAKARTGIGTRTKLFEEEIL